MKPIPDGYTTVTPWVVSPDTNAMIDYIVRAFGAVEIARVVGEDGTIGHDEVRIGDAIVMLFDSRPDWPPTPTFLRLYVDNTEATTAAPSQRRRRGRYVGHGYHTPRVRRPGRPGA